MKLRVYSLLKDCYWFLPSPLRSIFNGLRYTFVRKMRSKLLHHRGQVDFDGISIEEFVKELSKNNDIYIFELAVDWGIDLYQRPQHLATTLGRAGYLVIYKSQGDCVNGFKNVSDNVWITNELTYVDSLKNAKRIYFSTSVFNTCNHMTLMRQNGPIFYEYIDHISEEISGGKAEIRILNEVKNFAFAGGVDHIIATSAELYNETLRSVDSNKVSLIQNGVDINHYQSIDEIILDVRFSDFRNKYDIIVGYFGAVAPWLWYEMIDEIVADNKSIGFVMIGPDYGGCQRLLPEHDNFLWLGPINYRVLPSYAEKFDVCWIPFKLGDIAKTTSPLKLFEYFALGKPVVVTSDMRECTQYNIVFHGDTFHALNVALSCSIAKISDKDYTAKSLELATQNSWDKRAEAYTFIQVK